MYLVWWIKIFNKDKTGVMSLPISQRRDDAYQNDYSFLKRNVYKGGQAIANTYDERTLRLDWIEINLYS